MRPNKRNNDINRNDFINNVIISGVANVTPGCYNIGLSYKTRKKTFSTETQLDFTEDDCPLDFAKLILDNFEEFIRDEIGPRAPIDFNNIEIDYVEYAGELEID